MNLYTNIPVMESHNFSFLEPTTSSSTRIITPNNSYNSFLQGSKIVDSRFVIRGLYNVPVGHIGLRANHSVVQEYRFKRNFGEITLEILLITLMFLDEFAFYCFPLILTMMHVCIMLFTYRMPLTTCKFET